MIARAPHSRPATDAIRKADPRNTPWMNRCPSLSGPPRRDCVVAVGRHTGRTDIPLTERGECNARRLRARLEGITFTEVLVSPLQRARRTCELAGFAAVAKVTPDLIEWDYGDYDGRLTSDIRREPRLPEFRRSSGYTIPNCLGEFREIRESKQRTGIAADGHPAGAPGATGVERLRPRENGLRSNGGERGKTD